MIQTPALRRLLAAFAVLLAFANPAAAQTPRPDTAGDVSAAYSYMHDSSTKNFNGFRVAGAKNLSESWAAVVEAGWDTNGSGLYRSSSGTHPYTYTDTTVLAGIRLRRFDGTKTTPFFQVLGGYFSRNDDLFKTAVESFAVRTEVGLDVHVTQRVAFRFGGGWTYLSGGVRHLNQIGANAGLAYLFGKR